MAKFRINQFWIWVVSSVLILALFVLTLQLLIPLSPLVLGTKLRPEGTDHKHAHNTIYNPGEEILRAPTGTQRGRSPSFLFDFRERHDLESLDSKADEAWSNAMSTPLGGFLLVQHNETYYRGWGVSMFHSIHCLGMLRTSFQNFFGLADGKGHHGDHIHGPGGQMINERQHVEHCLGYIGRALLCNGDDTLEPPIGKFDSEGNVLWSAVSGEGHQHSCRDSRLAWQTVFGSEEEPVKPFEWSPGDTIQSVFGRH